MGYFLSRVIFSTGTISPRNKQLLLVGMFMGSKRAAVKVEAGLRPESGSHEDEKWGEYRDGEGRETKG